MSVFKGVGAFILAAVVLVGVAVGGYQLYWWANGNSTNRQRQIDQNNYGSQLAYVQDADRKITDVRNIDVQLGNVPAAEKPGLEAQRAAIVNDACTSISLIRNPPSNITVFAATECH